MSEEMKKNAELNETELENATGGADPGVTPGNPKISGCWFKADGGSEMRNGAYRKKCQAFACKTLVGDAGYLRWHQCGCWGSDRCIDSWHHERGCIGS
ncbi:MAG: hypothetical protein FWH32_07035 [Clostridiales bacterium]|nr:hypothetical protein [Clostridiales bacterium]